VIKGILTRIGRWYGDLVSTRPLRLDVSQPLLLQIERNVTKLSQVSKYTNRSGIKWRFDDGFDALDTAGLGKVFGDGTMGFYLTEASS
jgi:hypothetical protein